MLSSFRTVIFMAAVISFTVFLFSGCEKIVDRLKGESITPYECIGDCVPVRFVVHVPYRTNYSPQLYFSGSFNDWVLGDEQLELKTDLFVVKKAARLVGGHEQVEEGDLTPYWIDLELPAGDSISYRYAIKKSNTSLYPEELKDRTVKISEGMVQMDSVLQWAGNPVSRGAVRKSLLDYQQEEFMRIEMMDYTQSVESPEQVDQLMAEAERIWIEKGLPFYPGYPYLLAPTYNRLYYEHLNVNNIPEHTEATCHMLTEYYLPAHQRDLELLLKLRDAERSYDRTRLEIITYLGEIIYCSSLGDEQWQEVENIYFTELPLFLEEYARADTENVAHADRIKSYWLDPLEPVFNFRQAVNAGNLDEAEQVMNEILFGEVQRSEGIYGRTLSMSEITKQQLSLPPILVAAYAEKGEKRKALSALDNVSKESSGFILPSDSLKRWYEQLAGQEGLDHFDRLSATLNRDVLQGSGKAMVFDDFYENLVDGTQFDLSSLNGKIVVFDFWATYCIPCIAEIPELIEFQKEIASRDDMVFVSVNIDAMSNIQTPREQLENLIAHKEINYPVLYDNPENPISGFFEVRYIPSKYLVDSSGRLVSQIKDVRTALVDVSYGSQFTTF